MMDLEGAEFATIAQDAARLIESAADQLPNDCSDWWASDAQKEFAHQLRTLRRRMHVTAHELRRWANHAGS